LAGEELNYSILKSRLKEKNNHLITSIEDNCKGFIRPARFIAIIFRLFQMNQNTKKDTIDLHIKVRQFQEEILDEGSEPFCDFISELLSCSNKGEDNLIEEIKKAILFNVNSNSFGLPQLLLSEIAEHSSELILMLFYRVYFRGDKFEDEEEKKRMIGIITIFSWLGKTGKQNNLKLLMANIWPGVKKLDKNRFWSKEIVSRAFIRDEDDEVFFQLPTREEFSKIGNIRAISPTNSNH